MRDTLNIICMITISTFMMIISDEPISAHFQPSYQMLVFLIGILLIICKMFLSILPATASSDWAAVFYKMRPVWDIVFLSFNVEHHPTECLLVLVVIFAIKLFDGIIYVKTRSAVKNELDKREITRLIGSIIVILWIIINMLCLNEFIIPAMLWYECVCSCCSILLSIILLLQQCLFGTGEYDLLLIITLRDLLYLIIKSFTMLKASIYLTIHINIFLVRSVTSFCLCLKDTFTLLRQFPTMITLIRIKEVHLNQPELCVICQSVTETGVILQCHHVFHKNCILNWNVQSKFCPVCHQTMSLTSQTNDNDISLEWNVREL
ncbi:hypothetical protein ENUP19_0201G0007 [Entamoeba nuttalli]|uniref:Zinc finger domain containing protein n=2 Tax=Entamoeba nuttalli TaxID=412467 RepID=K2HAN0_ENTNP|nr:zinc finger domain containing protein [Entamoeba nuttalli P19]EKE39649.1 zinc finger domain containing protein [Entamoeba nuttalli P19]|eukprot:XP_008858016.1 zinc finger domain containing protein [Entamoeba nuttalli P19]